MVKKYPSIIIIFISFAGVLSILFGTSSGIGTTPDAVVYIGAARNMIVDKGLSIPFGEVINAPMTHHAPFYPFILGIIGKISVDPLIVARWFNAFMFGCLILIIGLFIYKFTKPSIFPSFLGSLIVLSAYPLLLIHLTHGQNRYLFYLECWDFSCFRSILKIQQ
jgi:hypothetical protein